jgi:thymidylate synthase ThyX
MIKAECVAASKCQTKIATFKVVMPRNILAEFNTHRLFTRNSASSRAIPFNRMVKSVQDNSFIPLAWQKPHKGMQGTEYWEEGEAIVNDAHWLQVRDVVIEHAQDLDAHEISKQVSNRILEPFMYHTVLVTATEWNNFFELRCPKYELTQGWDNKTIYYKSRKELLANLPSNLYTFDKNGKNTDWKNLTKLDWLKINKGQADIHMMAVAEAIYDTWNEADFKELKPGEWHIPYGDQIDESELAKSLLDLSEEKGAFLYAGRDLENLVKQAKIEVAVARCARLSYQTLGDNPKIDYIADLKLYNDLKQNGHWSPFEHVAEAMSEYDWSNCIKTIINKNGEFEQQQGWLANFRGWIQQRAMLENAA